MRVLNAFAGLGGNRKKWPANVEVTAVEMEPDIAKFYRDQYPNDEVLVGDAFQYILDNYHKFDVIWASVPCPKHSRARYWAASNLDTNVDPVYPDFRLYEVIVFLKHHFKGKWVVENVIPYYEPLIPAQKLGRHLFWANFHIPHYEANDADIHGGKRDEWQDLHGLDISGYTFREKDTGKPIRTDKILRNCVEPGLGLHVFESAKSINPATIQQKALF